MIKDTYLIGSTLYFRNQMIIKVNFCLLQVQRQWAPKQFRLKIWTRKPNWNIKNQWLCRGFSESIMNRIRVVLQNCNQGSSRSYVTKTSLTKSTKKNQNSTDHIPMVRLAHDLLQSNSYSQKNSSLRMLHWFEVAK